MRSIGCPIAVLALAGLGACGEGDASSVDAALDAAADAPVVPGPLIFRLSYRSDVPDSIFVQSGTELGGQGWLSVRTPGGDALAILDDCGRCNCDACDPCAVCGAGLPEVTEIPADGHLDWTWDARVFGAGTCPTSGMACEASTPLAPGAYVARFCWSWTSDGVGSGHHVGPLVCRDEPFTFPPAAQPIEHEECACG
jgi:hypothetical protein